MRLKYTFAGIIIFSLMMCGNFVFGHSAIFPEPIQENPNELMDDVGETAEDIGINALSITKDSDDDNVSNSEGTGKEEIDEGFDSEVGSDDEVDDEESDEIGDDNEEGEEGSGSEVGSDDEESDDEGDNEEGNEGEDVDSQFKPTGTLPIIYIEVKDEGGEYIDEIIDRNLSHKEYFAATYWIEIPEILESKYSSLGSVDKPLSLQIKARGNFTRTGFSKKPFKIKLDKKQDLLGLSPERSKHYALLAHADDQYGFLRNFTSFKIGEMLGLPWTPAMYPVELVINGNYRGLYFLTESIRVEKGRIDIEELEDYCEEPSMASGGYVVEIDNYESSNQLIFNTDREVGLYYCPLRISFESPENYSDIQRQFVQNQFENINQLTELGSDELWGYLDLDDAVRYYLAYEITGHAEAFHGSTYLYRDRGMNQKWHLSPLWDFGRAFDCPYDEYCDVYAQKTSLGYTWWVPDFRNNEKFIDQMTKVWKWFMANKYQELYPMIHDYVELIEKAAINDNLRWKDEPLPESVSGSVTRPVVDNSEIFKKENIVTGYLNKRVEWLKGCYGAPEEMEEYDIPERDDTPAAQLPDFMLGIPEISNSDSAYGHVTIYNLSGMRIDNPRKGEVYIIVTPTGSRKSIY